MSKYSFEDKLKILSGYKEEKTSQNEYAKEKGVIKAQFQYWLRLYELHGEEGLQSTYTNYTTEFKLDVLNFMAHSGMSLMDTAATFMLPTFSMVYEWKKKFEEGGIDALEPKKKGRPFMMKDKQSKSMKQTPAEGSVEALQAEIDRLRMENAYLKKLKALVQNKEKSPNKTKHR
jgi:transposase-like protein